MTDDKRDTEKSSPDSKHFVIYRFQDHLQKISIT